MSEGHLSPVRRATDTGKRKISPFRTAEELEAIREARQAQGLNLGIKGNLELMMLMFNADSANELLVICMKVPTKRHLCY